MNIRFLVFEFEKYRQKYRQKEKCLFFGTVFQAVATTLSSPMPDGTRLIEANSHQGTMLASSTTKLPGMLTKNCTMHSVPALES